MEGFGYDTEGHNTDVYESTPHSGGYYHVQAAYWPNGLWRTVNLAGVPWQTYLPDGEGRLNSVTASSGQNPVTSTTYNLVNYTTQVNYGSGDADVFSFDPDSGRTKQAVYNVGAQQVTTNLTWNPNGTLSYLSITDPLNLSNQQTCSTYNYDALGRLTQVTCGTTWQQTFSYDAFGNITKEGSSNWQPGYNQATNQFGTQFDANGNLLDDGVNSYTWDPNWGSPSSIADQALVVDSLGRMVENTTKGQEYVYAPGAGSQVFAAMNGQNVVQAQYPLPLGGMAIYNGSTLTYAHPDWQGSGRLVTYSSTRTMADDSAYAPFGEQYAVSGSFYDFTGQQQWTLGSNTGVVDFLFRRYSPVEGRWISPDPAGAVAVDITNPQTWNRYAYLANNPLSYIDPLGLHWACNGYYGLTSCSGWETDQSGNSTGGSYGSSGSYDTTVMGPGYDGLGGFAPVGQFSFGNGPVYQIDGSGQWYNASAGEQLSQGDAAELGLPDPSSFYGPSGFLGQQNPPPPPSSIFGKIATRPTPRQPPKVSPGPIRPGETPEPPQIIRNPPTGPLDYNLTDAAANAPWETSILVVLQFFSFRVTLPFAYIPYNPAYGPNPFPEATCPPGGC